MIEIPEPMQIAFKWLFIVAGTLWVVIYAIGSLAWIAAWLLDRFDP